MALCFKIYMPNCHFMKKSDASITRLSTIGWGDWDRTSEW